MLMGDQSYLRLLRSFSLPPEDEQIAFHLHYLTSLCPLQWRLYKVTSYV